MAGYRAGAGSYRGRKQWSVGVPPSNAEMIFIRICFWAFVIFFIGLYIFLKVSLG